MADVILVSKVNSLDNIQQAQDHVNHMKEKHITKPTAPFIFGRSMVTAEGPKTAPMSKSEAEALVRGKRVLVVDDGPTLTHGGMAFGAGYVLAKDLGAAEIVDPQPYAKGSLVGVFEKFPHLKHVLPAMGYGDQQVKDLEATIQAVDCDTVVIGTPSDITHLMDFGKPSVVARYELEVVPEHEAEFHAALDKLYDRYNEHHHQPTAA